MRKINVMKVSGAIGAALMLAGCGGIDDLVRRAESEGRGAEVGGTLPRPAPSLTTQQQEAIRGVVAQAIQTAARELSATDPADLPPVVLETLQNLANFGDLSPPTTFQNGTFDGTFVMVTPDDVNNPFAPSATAVGDVRLTVDFGQGTVGGNLTNVEAVRFDREIEVSGAVTGNFPISGTVVRDVFRADVSGSGSFLGVPSRMIT